MKTHTLTMIAALTMVGCSSKFDTTNDNPAGNGDNAGDDAEDNDDDDSDDDDDQLIDEDGDGVSIEDGDCDDEDDSVHPGADEICDGLDNDCDDVIDEGFQSEVWFEDADGDGFGNPEEDIESCDEEPDGYVANDLDCDDTDPEVHPDFDELVGDDIDNDCDERVDERFDTDTLELEGNVGYPSAIAIGPAGQVHIVYHDATSGTVGYTGIDTAGRWKDTVVVSEEGVGGEYLDAEIDASGNLHVAYTTDPNDWTTQLSYQLRMSTGSWSGEMTVDGGDLGDVSVGDYVDLALDADGTPSVAYLDEDAGLPRIADVILAGLPALIVPVDLNYASLLLEEAVTGLFTSLAIDSTGIHHVAFYDPVATLGFSPEVQYSAFNYDFDEIEISQTVDGPGQDMSIAVQSDDSPCVAFQSMVSLDLRFGCKVGGVWMMTTVDSAGATGGEPSLAINDLDEYFITFQKQSSGDLMLATKRKDTEWELVAIDTVGQVGAGSSLAIDADGVLHVSYYDQSNNALKYATGF